ncbi:pirin family protein [Echinicola sediminis]
MKNKKVEMVVAPGTPHFVGDGFRVHNFIPSHPGLDMYRMDPFILLDYNSKYSFAPSASPKGVGVHPHRGFETVTIAYQGKVEHHDSSGGGGVIEEGGVQWMTAASGVLHKEYHEREWSKKGGAFQMVQLWVNLPAKDKMSAPKYQSLSNDRIAKVALPEGAGIVEVIAGEYQGTKGSASTFSPLHLYNAKLKKGGEATFNFPENYNTALLVVEGEIEVNGEKSIPVDNFALLGRKGEEVHLHASEDAVVLVLSGQPLNEPIAAHGPFVMNSREQLLEAFEDFNTGKFGYLED